MENIGMNINVSRASALLGIVSGAVAIDDYILLEDSGFCELLYKLAQQGCGNSQIEGLISYIETNY